VSEDRRALLEAVAFGTDPAIRPSERLRALELLDQMPSEEDESIFREELHGLDGRELQLHFDAVLAAAFMLADEEGRRREWPATIRVLDAEVARRVELHRSELVKEPPTPVLTIVRDD
jgi:hypothetical protein